jgi:serine protease Do
MPIIEKLMTQETKEKVSESGYLGIAGSNVDSDVSKIYSLPVGVYVSEVVEGYGAANAGIQKGDIITEFDGTTITSMDDLTEALAYYSPGETVSVVIQHQSEGGYSEKTVEVTLSKKPAE